MESSGFVQILLFSWLNHIIRKGLKKTLEQEDLGECPETLKSKQALKKLETIIKEQEQKHGKGNISLFWIYMRLISTKITATFFVTLANIIVEFFCAVSLAFFQCFSYLDIFSSCKINVPLDWDFKLV